MTMTDPIADLLTRIRNASSARHERAEIPWSRVKEQICRVLVSEGYIREVSVAEDGPGKSAPLHETREFRPFHGVPKRRFLCV